MIETTSPDNTVSRCEMNRVYPQLICVEPPTRRVGDTELCEAHALEIEHAVENRQ
jgi:hypothetical protein